MAASVLDNVTIVGNVKLGDESRDFFQGSGDKNSRFAFSVAVTGRTRNPTTNQWEDGETTWHNYITAWGKLAENAHESLHNGDQVIVIGHNQTHSYTDKNGEQKSSTNIVADYIGVSLRWATAQTTKNSSNGGGSASYSSNRSSAAPVRSRQAAAAPAPAQAAAPAPSAEGTSDMFGGSDDLSSLFDTQK